MPGTIETEGKFMKTYIMYDISTEEGVLTVYVDDKTQKVHHGVYHESKNPVTLYPYEPNKTENALDSCTGLYTLLQVKRRLKSGTIFFK